MTNQFSPEAQRLYDELVYILRTTLADGDADDAIGCLDALVSTYWDDVLAEAAELIKSRRNAVHAAVGRQTADGMDRAAALLLAARTIRETK